MDDNDYGSINEPGKSRQSLSPPSVNEPPKLPEGGEKPVITSLEPPTCDIGDPAFTLDVTGTGFTENSQIELDGLGVTTTFNDATTLSTPLDPIWFPDPRAVPVTVRTGAQTSDPVNLTITGPTKSVHMADPDELEDEIEEAEEEGEFKSTHRGHSKSTHKRRK